jgi:hypothetical protein
MTSLEKAARAAFEAADGADWNDPDSLDLHDDYRAIARAVLLAVREDAEALKWSGHRAMWDVGNLNADELSVAAFTAMIDAILEKGDG